MKEQPSRRSRSINPGCTSRGRATERAAAPKVRWREGGRGWLRLPRARIRYNDDLSSTLLSSSECDSEHPFLHPRRPRSPVVTRTPQVVHQVSPSAPPSAVLDARTSADWWCDSRTRFLSRSHSSRPRRDVPTVARRLFARRHARDSNRRRCVEGCECVL